MKNKLTLLLLAIFFTAIISCENKEQKTAPPTASFDKKEYHKKGKKIAMATFTALSGKLQSAMKEGGVPNAVKYCSLSAYPLVDSLSKVHHADIRRVSLKARNPKDAPTPAEKTILEQYEMASKKGGKLKPIVQETDGNNIAFYAPIPANAFCLQCHGKLGETLSEENYAVIKNIYPDDKAIGYSDGDLRGMWSIRFEK